MLASWLQCDVRDQVEATFGRAAEQLGGLDVLLHAAGVWRAATPDGVDERVLDLLLATNAKAKIHQPGGIRADETAGRSHREHGASDGVRGNPLAANYAMSKAAVGAWTRSAARA